MNCYKNNEVQSGSHERLEECQAAVQIRGQAVNEVLRWSLPLKKGTIRCPETSGTNYQSTLRNIPEERRSHSHCGRSLQSRH
jgi:hypothetical protein